MNQCMTDGTCNYRAINNHNVNNVTLYNYDNNVFPMIRYGQYIFECNLHKQYKLSIYNQLLYITVYGGAFTQFTLYSFCLLETLLHMYTLLAKKAM